jgi:hypothetical protein
MHSKKHKILCGVSCCTALLKQCICFRVIGQVFNKRWQNVLTYRCELLRFRERAAIIPFPLVAHHTPNLKVKSFLQVSISTPSMHSSTGAICPTPVVLNNQSEYEAGHVQHHATCSKCIGACIIRNPNICKTMLAGSLR